MDIAFRIYLRRSFDTSIVFPNDDFVKEGWRLGAGARWRFSDSWSAAVEASALGDETRQLGIAIAWRP